MDYVKSNHYKVKLTCGYLATHFITRHPEYNDILVESEPYCKI